MSSPYEFDELGPEVALWENPNLSQLERFELMCQSSVNIYSAAGQFIASAHAAAARHAAAAAAAARRGGGPIAVIYDEMDAPLREMTRVFNNLKPPKPPRTGTPLDKKRARVNHGPRPSNTFNRRGKRNY